MIEPQQDEPVLALLFLVDDPLGGVGIDPLQKPDFTRGLERHPEAHPFPGDEQRGGELAVELRLAPAGEEERVEEGREGPEGAAGRLGTGRLDGWTAG